MLVLLALAFLFGASAHAAAQAVTPPRVAAIPRRPVKIRTYTAPMLDAEPEITPAEVRVVEIVPPDEDWDANVFVRPSFIAPMVGQVLRGARVAVRGEVLLKNARFCAAGKFYALEPYGF